MLVLLSLRTEALATTPPLADWLISLERDLPPTRLTLRPLTAQNTLQLVQSLAGVEHGSRGAEGQGSDWHSGDLSPAPLHPRTSAFAQWLFAETSGQPFYITETLKALIERNLLATRLTADGKWVVDFEAALDDEATLRGFLPPGVHKVIRARLTGLTPTAFTLLAAGAVLGHGFDFEHLCQVAGLGEIEALPALDELVARHLLIEREEERGAVARPYTFAHDKIRDMVYTEAGDARRRVFHRRAFELLQAAVAPAAELAHHARGAGLAEAAIRYSVAAGDDAMRLFAVRDAIAHYEGARQVLGESAGTPIEVPLQHRLYSRLGRAHEILSDYEQAQAVYQAMLAIGREGGEPTTECAALNRLATIAAQMGDLERASELLQAALPAAESSGDGTPLAETTWNLAQVSLYTGDTHTLLVHGERALALARELGEPELIARSLNVLGYGERNRGHSEAATAYAERRREPCMRRWGIGPWRPIA